MEIRRITRADAHALAELDKRCFAVPWSERSFEDETENTLAVYFAAEDNGVIAGYCGFWQVAGEGDITNIAVAPEYRRRGLGSHLLERALREAERLKLCSMTLEVRKSNEAAKALYGKFGFEPVGVRVRYYSDNNEDALIMMRRLKTNE